MQVGVFQYAIYKAWLEKLPTFADIFRICQPQKKNFDLDHCSVNKQLKGLFFAIAGIPCIGKYIIMKMVNLQKGYHLLYYTYRVSKIKSYHFIKVNELPMKLQDSQNSTECILQTFWPNLKLEHFYLGYPVGDVALI